MHYIKAKAQYESKSHSMLQINKNQQVMIFMNPKMIHKSAFCAQQTHYFGDIFSKSRYWQYGNGKLEHSIRKKPQLGAPR
jgi:hypothetical protein